MARADQLPGAYKVDGQWVAHADVVEAWASGWWDPKDEPWVTFAARVGLTETRCR